jgi:bifunctional UDP-N-acetylglucosamine pyrophosphorylase/glucosamine-1-phosphate N-acetyltransferase
MAKSTTAIILAAGLGVRMKSSKPKVLHNAAGRPMIDHVIKNLKAAKVSNLRIVVGHGGDLVSEHLKSSERIHFYHQEKQLGTANAVESADLNSLEGTVLICNGDHPLITGEDYTLALENFEKLKADLLVVGAIVKNPFGFGRIVHREDKTFIIVEEKEASLRQKSIREVNSGLYIVKAELLKKLIPKIKNQNSKKEFYLTDLVNLIFEHGFKAVVYRSRFARVCRGVNNRLELADASRALYLRKAHALLESGVSVLDPTNSYIEDEVEVEVDTVIHPGCHLRGKSKIAKSCVIEPHCLIVDSQLHEGAHLRWGTLVEGSVIGARAVIGPYARIRPESVIGSEAHVGNFVELKKTNLGSRSKANHLTYLGDAEIGEDTNIGCGTITCNYAIDKKKYKTKIGSDVFVGSDTQFIAPITVGDGAAIGSGSTITKDVPANALAFARAQQTVKLNYMKKRK